MELISMLQSILAAGAAMMVLALATEGASY